MPKIIDIMQNVKSHNYVECDIMLRQKTIFNPFRFQWAVMSKEKKFQRFLIDELTPWESQIPSFN